MISLAENSQRLHTLGTPPFNINDNIAAPPIKSNKPINTASI